MKTLLLCLVLIQPLAHADLDSNQQQGLHDTQTLLKSPEQRQEYFKKDPKAKEVDSKVDALAGSKQNKEDIYDLSSQVMEKITTESNGDPAKMQKLLDEAQKNPEAFYNKYFSDAQKAKLKSIAEKSDKRNPAGQNPH